MSFIAIIQALQHHGLLSRADLARVTGLSKPTVSHTVGRLHERALISEQLPVAQGQIGRPRALLRLNQEQWAVAAIDLGGTQARFSVGDASGGSLGRVASKTSASLTPDELVTLIRQGLHQAAAAAKLPVQALQMVALSLPGVVDPVSGALQFVPNLPHLEGVPLLELLEQSLPFPFLIDNDVNLAAYGQHLESGELNHSVFLGIGTGLGVGVVLRGEVYSGHLGRAGEIGYVPYGAGTIEDTVSGAGLRVAYHARTGQILDARQIIARAPEDPQARTVLDEFLQGLAWLVALVGVAYDPQRIFLGGGVGLHLPGNLDDLRARVGRQMPFTVPLEVSTLGDDAALHGGLKRAAQASAQRLLASLEDT